MRGYWFETTSFSGTPVRLYTITRVDETVIRITNWPRSITIGALTWSTGKGLTEYDITERNDGTPASTAFDVAAESGGSFDPADVALGLFDGAELEIDLANADNPTARYFHFYGKIYPSEHNIYDVAKFEARNPHAFPRKSLVPKYTVMCRHAFGDRFCGMPIMCADVARSTAYVLGACVRKLTGASPTGYGNVYFEVTTAGTTAASAPSYDYTIGNTTTDGSVVFTARNAWERSFEIATVIDHHNMILTASPDARAVDGWFNPGRMMFTSGKNKNRVIKAGYWDLSDKQVTTFLPAGLLTVAGDKGFIWPDCAKTLAMCHTKFANARRNGGFPYYEGAKAASVLS